MGASTAVGFREFWFDFRSILKTPSRRFAVIRERGSLWGSLTLMIAPSYFVFTYVGGVYFETDPFPGYSLLAPLIPAAALIMIKAYLIHVFARLLEGNGNYRRGLGTFRNLLSVFGYTLVPSILAVLAAVLLFLLFPNPLGSFVRNFRVLSISILVGLGVSLFVWALILTVLAMRAVYAMRDAKIIAAMFLGSIASGIPAFLAVLPVAPAEMNIVYIQPILSVRFLQFLVPDALSPSSPTTKISVHFDRIAYRFKEPRRFDLVAIVPRKQIIGDAGSGAIRFGGSRMFFSERREEILMRIVGLPGDTVELIEGRLRINGQYWNEPYIDSEYQSRVSLASIGLGEAQYLVLPEDRRLVESHREELVVERSRLLGRRMVRKWPLGWLEFRPTAFLQASPATAD